MERIVVSLKTVPSLWKCVYECVSGWKQRQRSRGIGEKEVSTNFGGILSTSPSTPGATRCV